MGVAQQAVTTAKNFEEVVTQKLATKGYQFKRGKRDPTVYTCSKTGATILHHVDDLRVAAANDDFTFHSGRFAGVLRHENRKD